MINAMPGLNQISLFRRPIRAVVHCLVFIGVGLAVALSAHAQLSEPATVPILEVESIRSSRGRAANFARIYAERLNGGIGSYRTASCMHRRDGAECLINSDAEGYRFRFLGGPPGWEQLRLAPTVETDLLISPDGREVVTVNYNGYPRRGNS